MTDFQRLKIEIYAYRRIAEKAEFFASVGESIEDAVTGQRGDGDWFGEVRDFFDEVLSIWKTIEEREAVGAVRLNYESPERYLSHVKPDQIGSMGLVEVLTLLRKATAAEPQIEEYNWTCPGDQSQKPDPERDQRFIDAYRKGLILPALRRLNDLLEITPADIEAVLSLKPIFDSLSVEEFRSWNGWEPMNLPEGGRALHVPYPDYHPVVSQWFELLYKTPFYIDPYAPLPEDPTPDGVPFSVMGAHFPPEYFQNASLDQVRRYMLLCTRGEKFCDGHIAGEFESGVIQAAFARLEQLMEPNHQQLPDHWSRFSLSDSFIQIDSGLWTGKKEPLKSCLVLRNVDFTNEGRLRPGTGAVIDIEARQLPRKALNHEDILVERSGGGPKQPVGRVVLYEDRGGEASFSNFTARLRVTDTIRIQPRFLLWCLFDFYAKGATIPMQRGATGIRNLDFDAYKRARHPLPPLGEQREIVRTLEAMLAARLARLREIELERERKSALMAHLFAYGTQNEPRRDTPLGPLPESWECVEIGHVAACQSGGTPSRGIPTYFGGRIPWVKTLDMDDDELWTTEEGITEGGLASIRGKVRPVGTVMVAMYGGSGTVGKCGILRIPAATNQAVCCVETDRTKCLPEFLFQYFVFIRAVWMQYAGGTRKDPNIGKGIVERKLIPLAPIDEQKAIADCLSASHNRVKTLEAEAKLLDELFRATLEELKSGRLSVARLLEEVVA